MRFLKRVIPIILCVVMIAMLMLFSACSNSVYVTSIEKTGTDGSDDIYTIYYSDGSTGTFTVTNSSDGGSSTYVTSISKTRTEGLNDIYTIYYSDGSTETFTVTNGSDGADGADGSDVSAYDLYEEYKKQTGDDDLTYAEFLELYLTVNVDSDALVANYCLLSSMLIYTEFIETSYSFTGGIGGGFTQVSDTAIYTGGAVIYSMDTSDDGYTYIVTNYHVVYDNSADTSKNGDSKIARKIVGYLYGSVDTLESDGKDGDGYTQYNYGENAIELEYVGGSISKDLAVLKCKTSEVLEINECATAVTLASGYSVGETAIAIGNPGGEGISVTKGIVSVDSEYINLQIDDTTRSYRSIRMDTAIYSGNSGGGLFNSNGELIGIVNASSTSEDSINYAVPLEIVTGTADSIIYYGSDSDDNTNGAYSVDIGLTTSSTNSKYVYDSSTGYGAIVEDIVVSSVESDSIAQSLGIQSSDVISSITINDTTYTLNRTFNLDDVLLTVRRGDRITLTYTRGGTEYTTDYYTVSSSDLVAVE